MCIHLLPKDCPCQVPSLRGDTHRGPLDQRRKRRLSFLHAHTWPVVNLDSGGSAHLSRAGKLCAGILLVLTLAVIFRGPLLEQLIVLTLRRALGLQTTIARVDGNVVNGLNLRGVSARAEAGSGPLAAFEAGHVSARYSLAALLRGKEAFVDSLDLTLEGGRVEFDLTAPPAVDSRPANRPGSPSFPRLRG